MVDRARHGGALMNRIEVRSVRVELGERSYDVVVGPGVARELLSQLEGEKEVAVMTDDTVARLGWFRGWWTRLEAQGGRRFMVTAPAGEGAKSWEMAGCWVRALAAEGFSRHTVALAVGGGVVGDLAGFVAASYLRGIRLVQVPTTLLAAVDSSVGGKTGVNLPEGKNLAGAFLQPSGVWIDTDFLETLPAREWAAGMAEVIKYGMIADGTLFEALERGPELERGELIRRCVAIKAAVVGADERELSGRRAVLNFGHTLGHAIEQASGYGEWLHGEAVGLGMVGATYLSEQMAGLETGTVQRLRQVLARYALPTRAEGLSWEALAPAVRRDKKATSEGVKWVLATQVGQGSGGWSVPEDRVREAVSVMSGAVEGSGRPV